MTAELVKFHFDPRCPWCYLTSRWIVQLERLGEIAVEWGIFCLEIVNAPENSDIKTMNAVSGPALRTVIALRNHNKTDMIGPFYSAIGKQVWEQAPPETDWTTVAHGALDEIGIDSSLCDNALTDQSTWDAVVSEHRNLVERTRSFGVPTIVLDGGEGPAIFGPVISTLPSDDDAVELWRHVAWLARYENFSELKRDRTTRPDLPAIRWRDKQSGKSTQ